MLRHFRPARFMAVGAFNTILGLAIIFLSVWFGAPALVANATGYVCGFLFSYALHRNYTFKHRGSIAVSMPRFAVATGLSYLLNVGVLLLTTGPAGRYLSQVAAVAVYATAQYLGSSLFVFREKPRPSGAARGVD